MADINPGASGREARLDCKRGGGEWRSLLRASAAGSVPHKQSVFCRALAKTFGKITAAIVFSCQ